MTLQLRIRGPYYEIPNPLQVTDEGREEEVERGRREWCG